MSALIKTGRGSSYGTSYQRGSAVSGAVTVFAAASNVRGAIVHRAIIANGGTSTQQSALIAHTAAPAAISDGEAIDFSDGSARVQAEIGVPIFLPPGVGLYEFHTVAAGSWCHVRYTLL